MVRPVEMRVTIYCSTDLRVTLLPQRERERETEEGEGETSLRHKRRFLKMSITARNDDITG